MKKLIAIALVLMLCLAIMPMAFADDLIPVGIINLDPAESGYREANVKNLTETFTEENGYKARQPTSSWKPPRASSPLRSSTSWSPLLRPPAGTRFSKRPRKPAFRSSCSTV